MKLGWWSWIIGSAKEGSLPTLAGMFAGGTFIPLFTKFRGQKIKAREDIPPPASKFASNPSSWALAYAFWQRFDYLLKSAKYLGEDATFLIVVANGIYPAAVSCNKLSWGDILPAAMNALWCWFYRCVGNVTKGGGSVLTEEEVVAESISAALIDDRLVARSPDRVRR